MKTIAKFDFGNTSVCAAEGWTKVERVYISPRFIWVTDNWNGWCETTNPKPFHDYMHGTLGDFRVGLKKGKYKIKLFFYDSANAYPEFKIICGYTKKETQAEITQPLYELCVDIPKDRIVTREFELDCNGEPISFLFKAQNSKFIVNAMEIISLDDGDLAVIYQNAPKDELPAIDEVKKTTGTPPIAYLKTLCDWLIEHRSSDGFLGDFEGEQRLWYTTAYPIRTILAYYDISGEEKYLNTATDILDLFVMEQMPEGGFTQAYRAQKTSDLTQDELEAVRKRYWMNLADIGSMVAALIAGCHYVTNERKERYINAARIYLDKWATRFIMENGGVKNAWLAGKFAENIYSVSTGMTALSMAMFYRLTGEEKYLHIAEKSVRFMMKDWNENGMLLNWTFDGVYPGHPDYEGVTEFGDVYYTYETLSCLLALTKDEALKKEIYDVYKKAIFGSKGLLEAKKNMSWWQIQNAWHNSKSVGTLIILQDFIFMNEQFQDISVDINLLKEEYELCSKFLTTPEYAGIMGVMLEDPTEKLPFEKHSVQSWTGCSVAATGFAGISVAQMAKYGIIYQA